MTPKDARLDIKTTKVAKAMLEQAANALGSTLSAFILDSAMSKAKEIIAQTEMIQLNSKETERFIELLQKSPSPNSNLKQLFVKYAKK